MIQDAKISVMEYVFNALLDITLTEIEIVELSQQHARISMQPMKYVKTATLDIN